MSEPRPEAMHCPFCGGPIVVYPSGYSEYDHACEACGAGFAIDAAAGLVRSRIWNRQAARGEHDEFPLARMRKPAP
jgi:hypothetical protein